MKKVTILIIAVIFLFSINIVGAENIGVYCNDLNYVFCDNFEGDSMDTNKWMSITSSGAIDWVQSGGKLVDRFKAVTIPTFTNFIYEIEVSPAPLTSGAGPTFRYQDRENYYLFQIRPASASRPYGHIVPHIRYNSTWIIDEPIWNEAMPINSETWYTYKVVGSGNIFNFFINDVHIGAWVDENNYFPEGHIGFRPQDYSHGAQYDNIRIKDSLIEIPNNINECKKDGWKTFNAPVFKNQGDCVSWLKSNENAKGNK